MTFFQRVHSSPYVVDAFPCVVPKMPAVYVCEFVKPKRFYYFRLYDCIKRNATECSGIFNAAQRLLFQMPSSTFYIGLFGTQSFRL